MLLWLGMGIGAADPGWTVERSPSPDGRYTLIRVVRSAVSEVKGLGESAARPSLVLECERRKLLGYVRTGLEVNLEGNNYDLWLAPISLKLDDGEVEVHHLRRGVTGNTLYFRKPKKWVQSWLGHERLAFGFVPFGAPPVQTAFDISDLEAQLGVLREECRI